MIELDYYTKNSAMFLLDYYVYNYPCEQGSLFTLAAELLDVLHHTNRITISELELIMDVGLFLTDIDAVNNQWLYNFQYGLKELGYYG